MSGFVSSINGWWHGRPRWARLSSMVILILFFISAFWPAGKPDLPVAEVQQGEFVIDLRETGTLRAENSITVSSPPIRISLQITGLVDEGTVVREGDFLIRFDTTEIKQSIEDKQADLDIAHANLERTRVAMSSELASLRSSIESSRASLRLSELRLEQMKFEADVRIEEGELNLKQAQISLEQALQRVTAQVEINSAEIRSLELKIRQAEIDLDKTQRDLRKLSVNAPGPGLVVYKETWKGGTMGKVKVGDTPWRGMALLELPDLSVMLVETTVSEVDVAKVEVGQEVEVKLDAYPDPIFYGDVIEVGMLASNREGGIDSKVFDLLVRIDGSDPLLRPGMSASARIIIDRQPDKIWVPIESVFDKNGSHIIYEASGGGWKAREVLLGSRNDDYVVIDSGVKSGAQIALADPTLDPEDHPRTVESEKSRNAGIAENGNGDQSKKSGRKRMKRIR